MALPRGAEDDDDGDGGSEFEAGSEQSSDNESLDKFEQLGARLR